MFRCHSPSCPSFLTPSSPHLSSYSSSSICKHPFIRTAREELKVFVRSTAILSSLVLHVYSVFIISSYNLSFVMISYNPILKYHFCPLIFYYLISCISLLYFRKSWIITIFSQQVVYFVFNIYFYIYFMFYLIF